MEKNTLIGDWLNSFRILSRGNIADIFSDTVSIYKKLFQSFYTRFIGIYILSMILCCLTMFVLGFGVVLIGWPLDFVFVSLARQFIDIPDGGAREACFNWDGTVYWKWFRMVAISRVISFLKFLFVLVISILVSLILVALVFLLVFIFARNTSCVQSIMHTPITILFSQLGEFMGYHVFAPLWFGWFFLPIGFIGGLIFWEDGRICESAAKGRAFILRFLPIFLLPIPIFVFFYWKHNQMCSFVPGEISSFLTALLFPFVYILYIAVFSSIYKKLHSIDNAIE